MTVELRLPAPPVTIAAGMRLERVRLDGSKSHYIPEFPPGTKGVPVTLCTRWGDTYINGQPSRLWADQMPLCTVCERRAPADAVIVTRTDRWSAQ